MDVFITGATGFIGSAVAHQFRQQGHNVTALAHSPESARQLEQRGHQSVAGSLFEPAGWQSHAENADVIVHAAHVRPGRRLSAGWLRQSTLARDTALQALIEAAERGGRCQALIYTSGIVAHGDHGENWTDETEAPTRTSALGDYHLDGERQVREAAGERSLPAMSLRPGMVYGNGGTFANHFLAVARKGSFQYPGSGENFLSFIHVDDLARAYVAAAERPQAGKVISVVDNSPIRMKHMAQTLVSGFGGHKVSSVPHWLVALFAGRALADMLVGSYRVSNRLAREQLDWEPRHPEFETQIEHVIQEFQAAPAK
ncbi:MAG TPA: NAD-dependent epimerase/dehydratase family protein [Gammaproteobacteria bacterium]|nr:NAD-dependent epimerase/dehydratase family protein [Gammaproteobacteria bacterium]